MNNFSKKEIVILLTLVLFSLFLFGINKALAFTKPCLGWATNGSCFCQYGVSCTARNCTVGLCPPLSNSTVSWGCTQARTQTCTSQMNENNCTDIGVCGCTISGGNCTYTCLGGFTDNGTACVASCTCGSWVDGSCGAGGCSAVQRQQTRTCSPGGCSSESQCVADASCCTCGSWTNGACGAGGCLATQRQQTRTCSPGGCSSESQCVADASCTVPDFFLNCSGNVSPSGCSCNYNIVTKKCSPSSCISATGACPPKNHAGVVPPVWSCTQAADVVSPGCTSINDPDLCDASTCSCKITGGTCNYTCDTGWTDCNTPGDGCECNKGAGYICSGTSCIIPPTLYSLTVNKVGSGANFGTVKSTPVGIDCGSTCSYSFDQSTSVTLTPYADGVNSKFVSWSGACTGSGSCVVSMTGPKTVTATFVNFDFNLTSNPTSDWIVPSETSVEVTVTAVKTMNNTKEVTFTVSIPPAATYASVIWLNPPLPQPHSCTPNPSCSVTFRIITGSNTPESSPLYPLGYPISITGSDGTITHSEPIFYLETEHFEYQIIGSQFNPYYGMFQGDTAGFINTIRVFQTSGPPGKNIVVSVQDAPDGVVLTPDPDHLTSCYLGSCPTLPDFKIRHTVSINAETGTDLKAIYKVTVPGVLSEGRCEGSGYICSQGSGYTSLIQELEVYAKWDLVEADPVPSLIRVPPGGTASTTINATLITGGPGAVNWTHDTSDLPPGVSVSINSPSSCSKDIKDLYCPINISITIPSDFVLKSSRQTYNLGVKAQLPGGQIRADGVRRDYDYDSAVFSIELANNFTISVEPGPTDDNIVLAPGSGIYPSEKPIFKLANVPPSTVEFCANLTILGAHSDPGNIYNDHIVTYEWGGTPIIYPPNPSDFHPVTYSVCTPGGGFEIYAEGIIPPGYYNINFVATKTDGDTLTKTYDYRLKIDQFDFSVDSTSTLTPRRETENWSYQVPVTIKAAPGNSTALDVGLEFDAPDLPSGVTLSWETNNTCSSEEMESGECTRYLQALVEPGIGTGNIPVTITATSKNYSRAGIINLNIYQIGDAPEAKMSCYASNEYCQDCFCDDTDTSTWVTYNGASVQFEVKNTTIAGNITESKWNIFEGGTTDPVVPPWRFRGDSAKNSITIPVSVPRLDPGTYTISLQVWDGNTLDNTVTHDITVERDVTADFLCSTDKTDDKIWSPCENIPTISSGSKVFFRDSPENPGEKYSKPSEGAQITRWVWEKKVGNDWEIFSSGSNYNPSTTLTGTFFGYDIRLSVQDSNLREASMLHRVSSVIPLPKWQEIPPF